MKIRTIIERFVRAVGNNGVYGLSGGENYYITSFKKTVVRALLPVWCFWFLVLAVPGKVWLFAVFLPVGILSVPALIGYSPVWDKFGYKKLTFWLMNLAVLAAAFIFGKILWAVLYETVLWRMR